MPQGINSRSGDETVAVQQRPAPDEDRKWVKSLGVHRVRGADDSKLNAD